MTPSAESAVEVMGTVARVLVAGNDADDATAAACVHLCALERLWSRFDAESEISMLNESDGAPVRVSPATATLVELSIAGYRATAGAFDPTVLGDVIRAGYDRTFTDMTAETTRDCRSAFVRGADAVSIDPVNSTVCVPRGVGIDPGGIGKGLAADLLTDSLCSMGATGVRINLGGDARVAGVPPDGSRWVFDIEDPWGGDALASIHLRAGALATSTTMLRAWRHVDQQRHHLIDPRSGQSIDTDLVSVTVVAARAWQAEVLTKAVFVAGIENGFALVDDLGAAALAITHNRARFVSTNWNDFSRDDIDLPVPQVASSLGVHEWSIFI